MHHLCVNSTKRRDSENQYQEITTANWGLATTNQRIVKSKKEGTDQESMQPSTTPDPGSKWESDNFARSQSLKTDFI